MPVHPKLVPEMTRIPFHLPSARQQENFLQVEEPFVRLPFSLLGELFMTWRHIFNMLWA